MIYLAFALLWPSGFIFSEVRPWRWSDGRGEFIPALTAVLDNQTGQDFLTARFLVRVHCDGGGMREYPVLLREVLVGRQQVEFTAYDSIGSVPYCPGAAEVLPLETSLYPDQERPAFIVFGFSRQRPGEPASTELEGVLDYRRHSETHQTIEFRPWRRHGARFSLPDYPDTAFYMIRVPAGRAGLAGFVVDPSPEPRSPLSRFLRFYDVPPGKAAYLGVFMLEELAPGRFSLEFDQSPDLARKLAPLVVRPLLPVRGSAPGPDSTLVIQ